MFLTSDDTEQAIDADGSFYRSAVVSVAAVGCLVTTVALCICCYGQSDDDEFDDNSADSDIESDSKTSLMTYRSPGIRDQDVNVARIQPNLYHQLSINKRLGLENQRQQSADFLNAEPEEVSGDDDSESCGDSPPQSACVAASAPLLGRIQIQLRYDFERMTLNLNLMGAEHLPAKDFSGTSDPYVKIMLLPDRKQRLVSNIRRKCLNPRWDEKFSFEGYPFTKLADKTLCLQVLDYDRFSRDDPIGEVFIPLRDVDIAKGVTLWQPLQPCVSQAGKLGQILISLCYQPSLKQVIVGIIAARGLVAKDLNGLSDPYVKVWLVYDGKRVKKQKTQCKRKTLDPHFNETFKFDVDPDLIPVACLSVVVMDHDIVTQNEMIGRVTIGPSGDPTEVRHWKEMLAKPQQMIERWHVLKSDV